MVYIIRVAFNSEFADTHFLLIAEKLEMDQNGKRDTQTDREYYSLSSHYATFRLDRVSFP